MIRVNCPICGRRLQGQSLDDWPSYPFCSARCKQIDLGRWLDESYGIPREEVEEERPPDEADIP
jgi:endogenous inhibitor of DNA gyrase (YacG/DUF329 family)